MTALQKHSVALLDFFKVLTLNSTFFSLKEFRTSLTKMCYFAM